MRVSQILRESLQDDKEKDSKTVEKEDAMKLDKGSFVIKKIGGKYHVVGAKSNYFYSNHDSREEAEQEIPKGK